MRPRYLCAGIVLLVLLPCVAYWPAMHGDFIFDDNALITQNRLVRTSNGLYGIWFTTEPQDYWPVTNTSLWIQWRLWGTNPTGYHVTNLALHIACCLLLWLVLRMLSVSGEFLAALLFAVHPVNVESVAWIAQLKNLLALFFFLISIACYVRAGFVTPQPELGREKTSFSIPYCLSVLAFILAMLSKGSVAVLPLILLLLIWWKRRRIELADWLRLTPFFMVALILAGLNVWFQTHGNNLPEFHHLTFLQRLLGASAVVWFYLSKAILPLHLQFIYPQWEISPSNPRWWLPLIGAIAATIVLWFLRNKPLGRSLWIAWLFWCIALLPVMGFTEITFMQHSRVADHYAQLALIAAVTVAAAGWTYALHHSIGALNTVVKVAAIAVVGGFAALTWRQSSLYTGPTTLYQATLEGNPHNPLVLTLLGSQEGKAGHIDQAIEDYQQALQINSDYADAHYALALALVEKANRQQDRNLMALALNQYSEAVRLQPNSSDYRNDYAIMLGSAGQNDASLAQLEEGLRLDPRHLGITFNLTNAYAQRQRWPEALALAQRALRLAQAEENTEIVSRIQDQLRALNEILSSGNPRTPPSAGASEDKSARP